MAQSKTGAHDAIVAIRGGASKTLLPFDKKSGRDSLADLIQRLQDAASDKPEIGFCLEALRTDEKAAGFLAAVFSLSPFLRDCALIRPRILARVLAQPFSDLAETIISETTNLWREAETEAVLMTRLREAKRTMALTLGLADLGGWLPPEEVTRCLSRFADAALQASVNHLLLALQTSGKVELSSPDDPASDSGVIVLGMGKFGAYELNYSSDIDIIIFFDLSRAMKLNSDDPTSVFVRFAKSLSRILQERTGDGYVFRVDLRLRPDPGSTPLAIPVETAFNYYEAYGQNWERAAFIKARAVAGDLACGEEFLAELAPFIWRKYLDFAAIQDVHSIKRQIHVHKGHGTIAVKGHNVKLGRGGIREIEFFAQTQQLIAGGRRIQLRVKATIDALNALRDDGWITADAASSLADAYWYLRSVEHRIQMVADAQSHTLPEDEEGLRRIALMMGNKDTKEFSEKLVSVMRQVETHYAALFEASPELAGSGGNLVFTGDDDDPETLETISRMGFKQPSQIISTVRGWHYGRYAAVRSAPAREMLTELTPSLIEAFSETGQPDQAFFSFDRFLGGLPAGIQFFAILKSNHNLVRLLVLILGSAPRLAEIITRKPHVFDGLIDPSFGASIPPREELHERLERALGRIQSYEGKLDQARLFAAEQKFLIGIRLINRTISARQAGLAYTDLAEVLLSCLTGVVEREFAGHHGRIKDGRIAILGMGRLGSGDLTASSDLDLIFLYDHPEDAEKSDGEKPLYAQQYFTRLVQRLITAMSAPTAEGIVYELDFRLRPSGNAGPLATHIEGFCKYQRQEAWTWEAQALVRARPVAGDAALIERIETELSDLLSAERDPKKIAADIRDMRKTLDKEKPAKSVFDVKITEGGLIDVEFITQWAALVHGVGNAEIRDTQMLLATIPDDIIQPDDRETLLQAYTFYNALLQIQRVCLEGEFDASDAEKGFVRLLCEQVSLPDIAAVEAELVRFQKSVRDIFKTLLK